MIKYEFIDILKKWTQSRPVNSKYIFYFFVSVLETFKAEKENLDSNTNTLTLQ